MDIATPLSSGSDFHLSIGSDQGGEGLDDQNVLLSPAAAEEDIGDIDVVGEEPSQLERLDSVQIDPSYQPESEELLYEGDIEHEAEQQPATKPAPVPLMEQDLGPLPESIVAPVVGSAASSGVGGQEEGFIVAVHDTSQDLLDVGTSSTKRDSSLISKKKVSGVAEKKSEKRRVSTSADKTKSATSTSSDSKNQSTNNSGSKTGRKVGTGSPSESAATPARFVCRSLLLVVSSFSNRYTHANHHCYKQDDNLRWMRM